MSEPPTVSHEDALFPRCWAAFNLVLIALTWRLWFVSANYPGVPVLGPNFVDSRVVLWTASIALIFSLVVVCLRRQTFRPMWWIVFLAHAVGFFFDQHRLQPWAYQTALYALVFVQVGRPSERKLLTLVAASIYFYSALGKLDYQFLHTVGQEFLATLMAPIGGIPESWGLGLRVRIASIFPVTELVLAIGLFVPATRRLAGIGVMGMHITLLAILGPWGLNHSFGVLGWNLVLLAQAYVLFVSQRSSTERTKESDQPSTVVSEGNSASTNSTDLPPPISWLSLLVVFLALTAPLLERKGYWDHWLSWSLYSPHTSRVELDVHQTVIEKLPIEIKQHLDDQDGDGWYRFAMSQWSLESRGVPIYPQARYQLGLAVKVVKQHQLDGGVRARLRSVSDRWTGARSEDLMFGLQEFQDRGRRYWLWIP